MLCVLYSVKWLVCSVQSTVFTVQFSVFSVQCAVCTVHCAFMYWMHCIIISVHCSVCIGLCVVYSNVTASLGETNGRGKNCLFKICKQWDGSISRDEGTYSFTRFN